MSLSDEKKVLTERLKYFIEEVFPCQLLPWLTCLTTADKQQIERDQDRHGDIKATDTLVDRIKRRQDGFSQFVIALRHSGSEHVAMLLDPEMKVENPENRDLASAPLDLISGTVVDLSFRGCLSDDSGRDFREAEAVIADVYGQPHSPEATRLRRELNQFLPPGAVFYKTKKGSVVCIFRVCRVSAAQELWEFYLKKQLHEKILQLMLTDEVKAKTEAKMIANYTSGQSCGRETLSSLKMELFMMEERYKEAVDNLREIESSFKQNESSRALSSQMAEGLFKEGDISETESLSSLVIPPVYLDSEQSGSHHLTLREYQKELAAPGLKGQNCIICAPANSGKTYVAIHIARNHLDQCTSGDAEDENCSDKKPKVIFIVSTLSLVLQQKDRFEYFLNDKYRVAEISGGTATEVPLQFLLANNDVVVLTPQILVNALKDKNSGVKLTDITMLMFDECHHTNKDHPYNKIMERYLALKKQPGMKPKSLPQVIGLTASLGVGKSKTLLKAKDHIIKLCSNLDAELISTVKDNIEELRKNINLPESKLYSIRKPEHSKFETVIGKVMEVIERKVGTPCDKPPQGRATQEYRQWTENLYNHAVAEGQRYLVTYAEQLREYHISLTIYDSTRMKDARQRLEDYFKGLDESKFTDIDRKLKGLYTQADDALTSFFQGHGEPPNPMLVKLKELILSYHTTADQTHCHDNESSSESDAKADQDLLSRLHVLEDNRKKDGSVVDVASGSESAQNRYEAASESSAEKDKGLGTATESSADKDKGLGTATESSADKDKGLGTATESSADKGKGLGTATESSADKDKGLGTATESSADKDKGLGATLDEKERGTAAAANIAVVDSVHFCSPSESSGEHREESKDSISPVENTSKQEESASEGDPETTDKLAENEESKVTTSNQDDGERKPKGIIFTQTRESTKVLEEWVAEDQDLLSLGIKPLRLLGSGDKRNGMTQHERESVIQKFKRGDVNLIIATTVAEEGLDIKECNYVIRYNMTGNEISSVQSRGRVRTDLGEYNVLAGAKSGVLEREHLNQFKEMLMTSALEAVQSLSPNEFKEKVNNLQERALHKCRIREGIKCTKTIFDQDDISFYCRKCNEFACQAHEIKRIQDTYHVIPSEEFLEKATIKEHPKPMTIDNITKKDKIYCGTCGEDWGITITTDGIELPCIKISSFVLRSGGADGKGKMYKKWSLCPVKIEHVDLADIAAGRRKENEGDDADSWDMDFN